MLTASRSTSTSKGIPRRSPFKKADSTSDRDASLHLLPLLPLLLLFGIGTRIDQKNLKMVERKPPHIYIYIFKRKNS